MRCFALIAAAWLWLGASASAQMLLSGTAACPGGSPSADGSIITPPSNCTLVDIASNAWNFPPGGADDGYGNKAVSENGSPFSSASAVEINLSGNLYFHTQAMFSPYFPWSRRNQGTGEFYQVASGASALPPPPFLNSTTSTAYQSLQDMVSAAAASQALTAHIMPTGIPAYVDFATILAANTTINCDAGVIIAASSGAGPGQGIFAVEAGGLSISGCEIAWAQAVASNGPFVGIQIDSGFSGFAGTNLNIHDNDMGILAGQNTGTIKLTNVTVKRGGSPHGAGSGDGFNHTVYLSSHTNTDSVIWTGGGCYDVTADGDDCKFRLGGGTLKGMTIGCDTAGNEGTHAGCWENWPVDIGCGGSFTLGAAGAGNGIVIERSPGAVKSSLVSFGEDIPAGLPNCPATPRTGQSLVITNAILIDDGPTGDAGATVIVNNPQAESVTVSNTKLVCGAHSNCASVAAFIGPNNTDGGGNTLFASRAAAGLAAYPALPVPP